MRRQNTRSNLHLVATGVILLVAGSLAVPQPAGSTTAEPTAASPVATCNRPHKAGQFAQSFVFQGKSRTYQLYVPPAYKGTKRVPLVFNFHGYGSNAKQQMIYGNFKPQANKNNFLVVGPDGQLGGVGGRHFNLGNEPGLQKDVDMVQALMTHLQATFCVDAARVYSTGMSDGGAMTSVLACRLPGKFAAFAAVAAIIYCGAKGGRPVAFAAFMGTADPIVPFNGGEVSCCGNPTLPSAPSVMANWAAYNGCTQFTDTRLGSEVRRRSWKGCKPGSATVFYIIDGGGHTWPGSIPLPGLGLTTQQIKAGDVIWKFFAAHKLAS